MNFLFNINYNKSDNSNTDKDFKYFSEQFADIRVLRYKIPGFEKLSVKQKKMLYYLYQAALCGRDIIWDQNYKYNLLIRKTLENIIDTYKGNRNTQKFKKFLLYTQRIWASNGIHHHCSMDKILPEFTKEYFIELIKNSNKNNFPVLKNKSTDDLIQIIFNPDIDKKRVVLDPSCDIIKNSANNFYENITQKQVEKYYSNLSNADKKRNTNPVSYGLNSKMIKKDGKIEEKVWKINGMYAQAIKKIVYWLKKSVTFAENNAQKNALLKLIEFYETGNLKTFDQYNILWLKDTESFIDVVNGFIEVYGDALGKRGTFESVVSIRDTETTKKAELISKYAQWFEDNAPINDEYKKKKVTGVTAKAINVVIESGDCSPSTPVGINLPNAEWIRKKYGSKSVTLKNIVDAYEQVAKNSGAIEEFAFSEKEVKLSKKYGAMAGNIHTNLHEIIGHGSGQLKKNVAEPNETLKNYASTLEEARADLMALYYILDPKLIDIGIMPTIDVGKTEYSGYIRNGLMTQLVKLETGKNIEESHMRNRQIIAKWAFEKGLKEKIITKIIKNNKTYFVINDYKKLRKIFGLLLHEVQRIKSEGDYQAGKNLVENYGVKPDIDLQKEVKKRWKKLNIAPYSIFINPQLIPVFKNNEITDVKIIYPKNFTEQMMYYSKNYSFLPVYN
jgi:dipeptidyl-peptidase-3